MKLEFGEIDQTWQQYGLHEARLVFNDRNTMYKAIVRRDRIVAITKLAYKLLPNEEAVIVADQAADLAGLVPFSEFTGDWFVKMNNHVIYDRGQTRVHALYCRNEHYDVNGEKMHIGVGIHNSIDGSTAFGCGIFTFRHACSNMVLAGTKGYEQTFDQRATIEYVQKRHVESLTPFVQNLKPVILEKMERAKEIIRSYNLMALETLNAEFIKTLQKQGLPKKILPDYIVKPEESAVDFNNVTKWQLYNDITEAIWHNAKTSIHSKEAQYNQLHAVIPLKVTAP